MLRECNPVLDPDTEPHVLLLTSQLVERINRTRENSAYLPGIKAPPALVATTNLREVSICLLPCLLALPLAMRSSPPAVQSGAFQAPRFPIASCL